MMEPPLISLMPVSSIERTKEGTSSGQMGIQSACVLFDVAKWKRREQPMDSQGRPQVSIAVYIPWEGRA